MPIVTKWFINAKMAAQARGAPPIPSLRRRGRVLVIDDEPGAIRLLQERLSRHEVVAAETADVALRMLSLAAFDVLIVDNWMRRISGLELLSYVAARHPRVRRILHTDRQPETFDHLQELGVIEFFVAKPGYFMLERLCDGFSALPRLAVG